MRRGVRFPSCYLFLVAVLGILSGCQSLRDQERFAIRSHAVLCPVPIRFMAPIIQIVLGYEGFAYAQ